MSRGKYAASLELCSWAGQAWPAPKDIADGIIASSMSMTEFLRILQQDHVETNHALHSLKMQRTRPQLRGYR